MGYLDHSTNNIILDAVLTDAGRKNLAAGGDKFKIEKFALGDDEVDYSIITKYGRTLGKEKIEKNTPVFEALTNETIALKYKTFGDSNMSSMSLIRLPYFQTVTTLTVDPRTSASTDVKVYYSGRNATASDMNNFATNFDEYTVYYSDRFINITSTSGTSTSSNTVSSDANRTRMLKIRFSNTDSATFNLNVTMRPISAQDFEIYGYASSGGANREITTYVTVAGPLGMRTTFPVVCKKNP